jgi:hypothetical protein
LRISQIFLYFSRSIRYCLRKFRSNRSIFPAHPALFTPSLQ